MNPHCVCDNPGFCPRHQIKKVGKLFKLCKGIANTSDCGFKYFKSWEEGKQGATAPDDPQLINDWECEPNENAPLSSPPTTFPRQVNPSCSKKPKVIEGVGTELHKLLSRIGFKLEANCKCRWWIDRMNSGGVEWCKANIEAITDNIISEGEKRGWKPKITVLKSGTRKAVKLLVNAAIKKAIKNGG